MNEAPVYEQLSRELRIISCRHAFLDIERVPELKREIESRWHKGQLDSTFYTQNLERLESSVGGRFKEARSVIIIAVPLPLTRLIFNFQGRERPVQIPPYYVANEKLTAIKKALGRSLGAAGYKITDARVPLKLAAVRSGLARYGRNNLAYIEGMGSFHRLMAFYSDLPAPNNAWFRLTEMEECTGCGFCLGNCHTDCLNPDVGNRFLARAERCLTLYNEEPGTLPEWIKPWLHNSLIGCMRCQSSCPLNRIYVRNVPISEVFDEQEALTILATPVFSQLPCLLREKLKKYDLQEYYDLIPRNLKFLLEWEL